MAKKNFERAEILCVGTELLIGDVVNTNATYLSKRLAILGIGVYRQAVVGDNPARLTADLEEALSRSDLVVMSGGLGPTYDDLTKETVAALFGRKMEMHAPSLARIESYFAATGRGMTDNNKKQAMMPTGAVVFANDYGTAPALALENDEGKVVVMLPGPPRELEPIFREKVEPYLRERCEAVLFSRNIHMCGIGESTLETLIPKEILDAANPTVAPYCATGEVRLRVTAKAPTETEAAAMCNAMVDKLMTLPFAPYVYGLDIPAAEVGLAQMLKERGMTVATAESCTGGLIAKRLTDAAGASATVAGGAVTYQTREKTAVLGVPADLIKTHTVVSEPVAKAMAEGALRLFDTDMAIATTGFAGPEGGTEKDPVGTVYIAVATKEKTVCERLAVSHKRDRGYIRESAATHAIVAAIRLLQQTAQKS